VAFGSATASNQVEVFAGSSAGVYAYRGAAINVTVTLSGGKYKVVIPEITVMGTAGTPDVKLSGTFQEM
jgi:ribosomal protein L21E